MKTILFIILISVSSLNNAAFASSPKRSVKEGNLLYNKGEFKQALEKYEDALLKLPESDIVNFNTGSALYKNEKYNEAISHFEKSMLSDDSSLQQKASFNLGNSRYKYGISKEESDLQQAVDLLGQALNNYKRSLELNPDDEDAKYNYEFVKKELARLQEKLKKQNKQCQLPNKQQEKGGEGKQKKEETQSSKQEQSQAENKESSAQEEQNKQHKPQESQEQQNEQRAEEQSQENEGNAEKQLSQGKQQNSAGQISKEQARMLLEAYRQQEEPRGLYKPDIPTRGLSEPTQDW